MRIIAAVVVTAVLTFAEPTMVVAQDAGAIAAALGKPGARIKMVQAIDINQLPDVAKPRVEEMIASTGDAMPAVRKSIDDTPMAASVLKDKGLTSAQVVAADISDGQLTLFARTTK